MYMSEHERIRRTAVAVADRFLRVVVAQERTAGWSMDQLARLSILEGAAGKTPGTWLRHKSRGFGSALEFFGPKLSAAWTSVTDQGVYDKAVATAAKALTGVPDMDAMDLVQNLTINSGHPGGADRNRIFHSVGKKLQSHKNDLGGGDIGPTDWRVLNAINAWVNNAAKDVLKSVRSRNTRTIDPLHDPTTRTRGGPSLDDEKRESLLLLALQSPGGPGLEVRRIVDRLLDQSFGGAARPIVRVFLEKISQPQYRSADQMRRMVKRFDPHKWFKQALNLVRQEMMAEMGLSSQQLTNALGGDAKKVFRFLRERVAKDSRIQGIVEDLAGKIELLEPGVSHVGKEEDEKEAELTEKQTPEMPHSVLQDWFEKDEYGEWDRQVSPHAQHLRGPVELKVARAWLLGSARETSPGGALSRAEMRTVAIRTAFNSKNASVRRKIVDVVVRADWMAFVRGATMTRTARYRPAFMRWVEGRKFRQPDTSNDVLFVSLPVEEQKRIYGQWQHDRLEWAQRHKPEGLGDETRITPENFDDVKKDDVVWLSWSPVVLHKVVNIDRSGPRRNNPILEFVQIDPRNPGWEGETRHMHRSTLQNQEMEAHRVPGVGPRAEQERQKQEQREKALSALPQEPPGGWPDFQGVVPLRHGEDAQKAQAVMRAVVQEASDPNEVTFEKVRDRLREAIGHRAGPRAVKEILKEIGKWADELAKAAQDGGPDLKAQAKAFRAVRLKVDEALRKADDAVNEHVKAVGRLARGRPMVADDILQHARNGLSDEDRKAFGRDFSEHLREEWDDPKKGVRELKEIGRRHFGRNFNEGVFRDMLLRAWDARASWLDEDGVQAVRDNLEGITGRDHEELVERAQRNRRDRAQFPEIYELPIGAMRAVKHAIEQGVEELKGGQRPDQKWLDKIVAKAAEGHGHDLAGVLGSIVGAMANLLKDDMEDAERHPSANRQAEGATWGAKLKKLQELAGKVERESEHGIFRGPSEEPSAVKKPKEKKPKEKKQPEGSSEGDLSPADPSAADWEEQGRPYVPPHYRGVYKHREELRGKARSDVGGTTRVRPPQVLISLAAPSGLSADSADMMRKKMRDLTFDGAKDLFGRINHALENPDSQYMEGLRRNGYTEGDLKALRKGLKKHLAPYVGRRYDETVLAIANNFDLEPEDADALYEFRGDKPGRGTKLSDAQVFEKFLAKAKPETRDRMRGMPLAEFMDMYKAIMAEDEEDNVL